jgi:hypothetical protein
MSHHSLTHSCRAFVGNSPGVKPNTGPVRPTTREQRTAALRSGFTDAVDAAIREGFLVAGSAAAVSPMASLPRFNLDVGDAKKAAKRHQMDAAVLERLEAAEKDHEVLGGEQIDELIRVVDVTTMGPADGVDGTVMTEEDFEETESVTVDKSVGGSSGGAGRGSSSGASSSKQPRASATVPVPGTSGAKVVDKRALCAFSSTFGKVSPDRAQRFLQTAGMQLLCALLFVNDSES